MQAGKWSGWFGAMVMAASASATVQAQSAASAAHAAHAKPLRISSAATTWTLVDLGTLGGPGSYATAVSDAGLVVGCSDAAGAGTHAFVYQSGVMRDLGTGTDSASGNSCAYAVNDTGTIAGRAASGELVEWTSAGVTHLGVQGTVGGVNASGVVVGSYNDGAFTRAFSYREGVMKDLGNLGTNASTASSANAINDHGQIVGNSNGHAFLYEGGTMRDLGTLGGNSSIAKGLNDVGEIVGMASDANGAPTPFAYTGAMHALPAPTYSAAIAVNNRGQVIGSGEGIYGYLVDGGTVTRLDTIPAVAAKGWRHLEPTGINERGWIAGTAMTPAGDLRAFLLVPQ
jgi:probable HAF family extracellular repeat protein